MASKHWILAENCACLVESGWINSIHEVIVMKKRLNFLVGFAFGVALVMATGAAASAAIQATLSNHPVCVNGEYVDIQGYLIAGHNYYQLRDLGTLLGFNVYWDDVARCVQIESGKPYTGEAPAKAEPDKPLSRPEDTSTAIDVNALKQDIIDRTNALRKENGVAELRVDDKLMQAAQVRADEMAASGIYSHTRPDGRRNISVTDCQYVGENIHRIADWALQGKSASEVAVWSWNLSGGHRDNLLEKNYAETGVGLARGVNDNGEACWYCVQLFLWNGYSVSWVDAPAAK